jgi:hypothetical protein
MYRWKFRHDERERDRAGSFVMPPLLLSGTYEVPHARTHPSRTFPASQASLLQGGTLYSVPSSKLNCDWVVDIRVVVVHPPCLERGSPL